jgi:hypothetical protein
MLDLWKERARFFAAGLALMGAAWALTEACETSRVAFRLVDAPCVVRVMPDGGTECR